MQQDITFSARFYALVDWFENNRKQVAIGAVVVVVAALAVGYYLWDRGEKEVSAGDALSHVLVRSLLVPGAAEQAADEYKKVAEDFAGTKPAAQALLEAGTDLFTQGRFADAQTLLQQLVTDYPESPLLPEAQYGAAACLDAQGKTDDALAAYQHVIASFPNSDVIAQAKFSAARILESQGKLQDAMNYYEDIVRTYGLNNTVGSEAGIRGEEVKRRLSVPGAAPEAQASVTPSLSASDFTRSLTNLVTPKANNKP